MSSASGNDASENEDRKLDQQATARAGYNRLSRVYGMLSDSSEKRFVREAVEEMLRPAEGERILEPGFGSGQVLVALAELVGPNGHVAGVDISDGMVEQAGRRLREHGLADRVELRRASATDLPFPDESFDAVFMSFTLELFPDDQIPIVLAECARVIRPDGRLCVAAMSADGGSAAMEKLYGWSHRHFPTFVDCRPIPVEKVIETAGFALVERRGLSMWGLAVELVLARPPARAGQT
ncbi:MAG: methyltransferase domain-containing protein [Candidatus Nanopelagicales bacterium]|nr:methyltransferase domain-containing protein [Candidatus Nanopelagicales bacterium]